MSIFDMAENLPKITPFAFHSGRDAFSDIKKIAKEKADARMLFEHSVIVDEELRDGVIMMEGAGEVVVIENGFIQTYKLWTLDSVKQFYKKPMTNKTDSEQEEG